jgi:hypothetical protein
MASNVTLATLREQARARADMKDSGFISASELDFYINSEIQELYDLLTTKFEDYYLISTNSTVLAGTDNVALPSDFYKLRGIDIEVAPGQFISAKRFTFQERNLQTNPLIYPYFQQNTYFYQIRGNTLYFLNGNNQAPLNIRIWYVPVAAKLVNASDNFDGINGYEEYVIVGTAMRMLQKEESDVSVLFNAKQLMKKRIEETAANRDVGLPSKVTDVQKGDWESIWPGGRY